MISMSPSARCFDLIKQFEGCRLQAYLDSAGIATIGYGHTHGITMGMTCSQEQADSWLAVDASWAESCVNLAVHHQLTQNQFDALVCFVFNVGCAAFQTSTMLRFINAGSLDLAAKEFRRWDRAAGVELQGLLRRRIAEQALFSGLPGATLA